MEETIFKHLDRLGRGHPYVPMSQFCSPLSLPWLQPVPGRLACQALKKAAPIRGIGLSFDPDQAPRDEVTDIDPALAAGLVLRNWIASISFRC